MEKKENREEEIYTVLRNSWIWNMHHWFMGMDVPGALLNGHFTSTLTIRCIAPGLSLALEWAQFIHSKFI